MNQEIVLPYQVAQRLARRRDAIARQRDAAGILGCWRETFVFPRHKACLKAREWMDRVSRSAFITEVESWRQLSDGRIECTVRRVPADR